MKHQFTIEDLLDGCRKGERKSQELLYKLFAAPMLGLCTRYAKDRYEAEGILQVGFIKVFKKINEFRDEGSFEGWIKRIMVNSAIEVFRKNQRMMAVMDIEEAQQVPQSTFDMSNLEIQDLLKLIQALAPGYRVVFNMYVIEGFSHKEIAEQLGISEGASKSQLSRARTILKEKILKMEGDRYAANVG